MVDFLLVSAPIGAIAFTVGFNCGDSLRYRGSDGILYYADREFKPGTGFNIYRKDPGSDYVLVNDFPVRIPRFIDGEVEEGLEYKYRISAVDFFGKESPAAPFVAAVPVSRGVSPIPSYQFLITEENLAWRNTHVYSEEYVPVAFEGDGSGLISADFRYRGKSSREWHKKGHKFRFENYILALSAERINLKGAIETSLIREHCAFRFFHDIGLPASEASFRLLWRNEQYRGLFTRIEQVF